MSQKVRPRKTWLLGSSNSARRTARRSTGSAALCALWKPENSIAGASPRGLADRARAAAGKVERTKNMVLYYLLSRDLKKIEGYQFTLRAQKNSQDSVRITDEAAVPKCYCRIDARIDGVDLGDSALTAAGRARQGAGILHPGDPAGQRCNQGGCGAERTGAWCGSAERNAPQGRVKRSVLH